MFQKETLGSPTRLCSKVAFIWWEDILNFTLGNAFVKSGFLLGGSADVLADVMEKPLFRQEGAFVSIYKAFFVLHSTGLKQLFGKVLFWYMEKRIGQ